MRAFRHWSILAVCLFGLAAWGYHASLSAWPRKILVIVDASYPMATVWDQVPPLLESLTGGRYRVYALATDKGLVHGWQPTLELGATRPYGPRRLADLPRRFQSAMAEALETTLITNAPAAEVPTGAGWKVLSPAPQGHAG